MTIFVNFFKKIFVKILKCIELTPRIDYEKFQRLVQEQEEDGTRGVYKYSVWLSYIILCIRGRLVGKSPESEISFLVLIIIYRSFSSTDYTMPTPPWAVFGSTERGFDPEMRRVHRKKKADPDG